MLRKKGIVTIFFASLVAGLFSTASNADFGKKDVSKDESELLVLAEKKTYHFITPVFALRPASLMPVNGISPNTVVKLEIQDGVATLLGSVDSRIERDLAGKVVASIDGVKKVRNLLKFEE